MKAVVFDMDGTLIAESSWELLHSYFEADPQEVIRNQEEYFSQEIDYQTWMQKDLNLWDCPSQKTLEKALSSYTLEPSVQETVSSLKNEGIIPCIVSSGIDILARFIGTQLGIENDCIFANEIICENGALRGICHVEPLSKDKIVFTISKTMSIPVSRIAAVGDAAPDVSLFRAAALTFAYNPKDTIIADAADYVIDDLRTILSIIRSLEKK
jgi:HAD superfamily phosphoserine phosphatase-like hydrolase